MRKIKRIEGFTLETLVGSDEGTTNGNRLGILDRFNEGLDEGCCDTNKLGIEVGRKEGSKIRKSEGLLVGTIDARRLG